MYLITSILFLLTTASGDDSDIFASTWDLQRLLVKETEFSSGLTALADSLEREAAVIRKFVAEHYAGFTPGDAETHVSHPLNALALVKRTGYDLGNFVSLAVKLLTIFYA